jgi:hypothetical protein
VELNPQKTLDQLEDAYKSYLGGPPEQRAEAAVTLQRAISRGEIEVGNLARDVATDFEKRMLHKRLICTIELARGSMDSDAR